MALIADFSQPDPEGRFAAWTTGQFDPCITNRKEALALQHLREELFRLKRRADRLTEFRLSIEETLDPEGHPKISADDEQRLYEESVDFASAAYACLGSMASVFAKFARRIGAKLTVPTASVDKFVKWLGSRSSIPEASELSGELQYVRDFRTIVVHAGMNQPFDWATARIESHSHDGQGVIVFGKVRNAGQVPAGARSPHGQPEMEEWADERHDESAEIHWAMASADEQTVMIAMLNLVAMFGALASGASWEPEAGLPTTLPETEPTNHALEESGPA